MYSAPVVFSRLAIYDIVVELNPSMTSAHELQAGFGKKK